MSTKTDELMRLHDEAVSAWAAMLFHGDVNGYAAKADALRASIQEVVKDAERYRWLRSIDSQAEWDRVCDYYADALDSAIDAAMKPEAP